MSSPTEQTCRALSVGVMHSKNLDLRRDVAHVQASSQRRNQGIREGRLTMIRLVQRGSIAACTNHSSTRCPRPLRASERPTCSDTKHTRDSRRRKNERSLASSQLNGYPVRWLVAKRPSIEERIDELGELGSVAAAEALALVRKGLAVKTGLIVEAAVRAADMLSVDPEQAERFCEAMEAAFATLSETGVKRDPQCRGKLAIAVSLRERGWFSDKVFRSGIELVQLEPVWGGTEDSAAELRAECGLAFSALGHPDAMNLLATLLADSERNARIGAAIALGNSGRIEAIPLLRYKSLSADPDAEVLSATLSALLNIDPDGSVGFVGELLGRPEIAPAAALCLGESRRPEAFSLLREWSSSGDNLEVAYLAIALLRSPKATDFLLDEIRDDNEQEAKAAIAALETFAHDPDLATRLATKVSLIS